MLRQLFFVALLGLGGAGPIPDDCQWATDFDTGVPGNAHMVDSYNGNLLMRIAYPAWGHARGCILDSLIRAAGDLWPTNDYELFDVSLSDDAGEEALFGDRLLVFRSNYTSMPEVFAKECAAEAGLDDPACPLSMQPRDVPREARLRMASNFEQWDADNLEAHVQAVRRLLLQTSGPRRVIFFHCDSGKDRTGEFFAAYAIRFLNVSLRQAMAFNVQAARRPIIYSLQVNAQWYCEHLRVRGLYRHADCNACTNFTQGMYQSLMSCDQELVSASPSLSLRCQAVLDSFNTSLCSGGPDDLWYTALLHSRPIPAPRMALSASAHVRTGLLAGGVAACVMSILMVRRRRRNVPAQAPLLG